MDIQTKDGILLRGIPDGTPDEVIKARINQIRGESSQAPKQDGGFRGSTLGGIVQGIKDPIDAGAQMLYHGLDTVAPNAVNKINEANNWLADKTGLVSRIPEGGIDQQIKQDEQAYQQDRAASGRGGIDAARIGGNVASTLPLMMIPGGQTLPAQIASGTAIGAASGALQPVIQGDFGEEKLKQVGVGSGLGGAFGALGSVLGKAISPTVRPEVQSLLDDSVRLTPGQIMGGALQRVEDKAQSIPLVGDMITGARNRGVEDLNRAAYARALKGTNINAKTLPVGQEGIKAVKEAVGKQYDELLPKLSFKPDAQFNQELNTVKSMAQNLGEKESAKYQSILDDVLSKASPNGGMTGETYKIVESKLGNEVKKFAGSTDAYQRELADALKETSSIFKSNLERSNPQFAKELGQANSNYANYVRLRAAGSKAGDMSGGFSPAQLAAAIRMSDKSVGKGNVATGQALMQDLGDAGVNIMGSKVADSGTATRLMLGGAAGGAAYVEPTLLLGAGAASLPYTKVGQKLAQALLTKRPTGAKATAEAVRKTLPLLSGSFVPSVQ
jgi:hypothetical protein